MIHETAVIMAGAKLGTDVEIGPFCVVGKDVVLGDRVRLISHVVIEGKTEIGDDTIIYSFAVVGSKGQDLKFQDDESMTGTTIGKRCKIREYATINSGTPASPHGTVVGDDCQIMINAHIAHDCQLGNNIVLSNIVQIAGHVEIEDNVIVSGGSMVHQFCRIGRNAFIGGMTGIGTDVLPYSIFEGPRGIYRTINRTGLIRHGFTHEDMHAIHTVYSAMFSKADDGTVAAERLKKARKEIGDNKYGLDALDFIENRSKRGISGNH
ncbi:acyl-[acyl-carrier-protein]--UDP-N-acetylglucosamine O-acyltransferase [Bacteroidia bacterium]|nr:acyl-[acyl-carrier-protein]--UDP-N-acetylglucosamine O-acyltransferase [Bacteroidia bacterium]